VVSAQSPPWAALPVVADWERFSVLTVDAQLLDGLFLFSGGHEEHRGLLKGKSLLAERLQNSRSSAPLVLKQN
jgi:hypothetical protein